MLGNALEGQVEVVIVIVSETATGTAIVTEGDALEAGSNKIASVVNQLASPTLPEVILPTLCLCSTLPCCFYERHAFNHPLQSTASIKHFASLPTSVQGLANHFLSFIDLCTLHNDSSVTCVSESRSPSPRRRRSESKSRSRSPIKRRSELNEDRKSRSRSKSPIKSKSRSRSHSGSKERSYKERLVKK
ncbi:PREDICTED: uncharacterized protein LOC107338971 isoform X2 [Acropora digitifera]|uniref:uncharacterized protein LOC107338971 isoform X2 n=1 Tax=Acropora digitifera TaxID=70779 RepID=UPI00077AC148|nr:PREDICTED: uncharacterized protein LOC107338971 isoform X2 [Acropora digitifera]